MNWLLIFENYMTTDIGLLGTFMALAMTTAAGWGVIDILRKK